MSAPAYYKIEVGIGNWGLVRAYLDTKKFLDPAIDWLEGRGWITREFTVRGPPEVIEQIRREVEAITASMNAAPRT